MLIKKPIALIFVFATIFVCGIWTGMKFSRDDNGAPTYGTLGLPVNCRAYVQSAIDGYRTNRYNATESMSGLERNCGVAGNAWKNMRDD